VGVERAGGVEAEDERATAWGTEGKNAAAPKKARSKATRRREARAVNE
jgi:hypothetical protein